MSAFEYVFTFYSLVLGLAAANVVTGFADMWRERSRIAVGICVPLVALSLLVGIMNAWVTYWQNGASVEMGPSRMIGSALIALPYVFASKVMFPAPGEAASLEDHYFAHRRVLLLALAAPPLVGRVFAWMAPVSSFSRVWRRSTSMPGSPFPCCCCWPPASSSIVSDLECCFSS